MGDTWGLVERLHKTMRAEFFTAANWQFPPIPVLQAALDAWVVANNTARSYQSCGAARPRERFGLAGFMGHLTRGQLEGVYDYVKGAFLVFCNATAHRRIPYTAAETEDIIHGVNLCLRMLPARRAII